MTGRTVPTRMSEKFPPQDPCLLASLVGDARIGHVAFAVDGAPRVLPSAIAWADGGILLHGSTGSTWMRHLATGVPVAVSVATVDALVVARSAFESSMNYRSAVVFGSCVELTGEEKSAALDALTDALIPGRMAELRRPSARELAATLVLRVTIDEWSLKAATGWPEDDEADVAGPAWAGVLPLRSGYTTSLPAPDLAPGIPLPDSVRRLLSPA